MRVQICYADEGDSIYFNAGTCRKKWVTAFATCHPAFVITPLMKPRLGHKPPQFYKTRYVLTHRPTGLAVAHPIPSQRAARYIAGALSGLPLPWATMKFGDAVQLPAELKAWLHLLCAPLLERKA